MRVFRYVILILTLTAYYPRAQAQIELDGVSSALEKKLRRTLAGIDKPEKKAAAESLLVEAGYLDVRAEWLDRDNQSILKINPGNLYRFRSIIQGEERTDTIRGALPFSQNNIERIVDSLLARERERGFYYASLKPEEIRRHGTILEISMTKQSGPCITVSTLDLQGLGRTRPDFIRRYININEGDTLRPSELTRLTRRLGRLDFISLSGPPEIIPETGYERAGIRLTFREAKGFRLEGGGGYIPDDNGYFLWYIDTRLENFFGSGQQLMFNYDRREKDKSLFGISYRRPIFWLGLGTAGIKIATRDYRDSFYEFRFTADCRLNISDNAEIGLRLNGRDIEPFENRGYRVTGVGIEGQWGDIPEFYAPAFHPAVTWEVEYQSRKYDNRGDTAHVPRRVLNETRSMINLEFSRGLFRPLTTYLRGMVQDIKSSESPLPAAELFLFGGPGTLRGYRHDQFAARRLAIATLEERWFVGQNSYIYPFFEAAYYEFDRLDSEGADIRDDDFLNGFGLGISLIAGNRRLRWEFAWGEGVSLDQPRLNVIISDRF